MYYDFVAEPNDKDKWDCYKERSFPDGRSCPKKHLDFMVFQRLLN